MPEINKQAGITLVEILVGLVMIGIIITGIYNLFRVHNIMAAKQEETTRMQQELLTVMVTIADDLRMCGYSPAEGSFGFIANDPDGYGRGTNTTSVYCTKDVLIENGVLDNDNNSTEHAGYRLNVNFDGSQQATPDNILKKFVPYANATKWDVVATNIGDLQFTYLDSDGNEIIDPSASISSISAVQFTATAIPAPERAQLGLSNRTMTSTVICRNVKS